MPLQVDIVRVDYGNQGFSFPVIQLHNRRAGRVPRLLRWVCQRHLEILYNRTDGGSSGAIWKALINSGLQSTSLCCMHAQGRG